MIDTIVEFSFAHLYGYVLYTPYLYNNIYLFIHHCDMYSVNNKPYYLMLVFPYQQQVILTTKNIFIHINNCILLGLIFCRNYGREIVINEKAIYRRILKQPRVGQIRAIIERVSLGSIYISM